MQFMLRVRGSFDKLNSSRLSLLFVDNGLPTSFMLGRSSFSKTFGFSRLLTAFAYEYEYRHSEKEKPSEARLEQTHNVCEKEE